MPSRDYRHCPACCRFGSSTRMVRIRNADEVLRSFYLCRECGGAYTHHSDRDALIPGWPDHVEAAATRMHVLAEDGTILCARPA